MTELMVIFVIGLLVLGPKRLPALARSLGRSLAEFRRASTDLRREFLDISEETRFDLNDAGQDQTPGAPGNENADSTPGPPPVQGGAATAGGTAAATGEETGAAPVAQAPSEEPEPGQEDAGAKPDDPAAPTTEGKRESNGG